jgi:hypothetical protein
VLAHSEDVGSRGCGLLDGRQRIVRARGQVDDREFGAGQRPGERRRSAGADRLGSRGLA